MALLSASTVVWGVTPLRLDDSSARMDESAVERLSAVSPYVPACDKPVEMELAFTGTVDGAPEVALSGNIRLSLGPTVGVEGQEGSTNLLRSYAGDLRTGGANSALSWKLTAYSVGPFLPRSRRIGDQLSIVLPSQLKLVSAESSSVYALLVLHCLFEDRSLRCSKGFFAFENEFAALANSPTGSDQLFHPRFVEAVRHARARYEEAQARSTNFIWDCCYGGGAGTYFCNCKNCWIENPEPEPCNEPCPSCFIGHCLDCLVLDCYYCPY